MVLRLTLRNVVVYVVFITAVPIIKPFARGEEDSGWGLCDGLCPVLVCRGRYGLGRGVLLFILGSNLGGVPRSSFSPARAAD